MKKSSLKSCLLLGILTTTIFLSSGCSMIRSNQGATFLGTATGSAIGAAIGKESGNPVTGAVIGAIGGGLVGQAMDQQRQQVPAAGYGQQFPAQPGISIDEVIRLSKTGMSKEIILNQIRTQGFAGPLTTDQLVLLSQQQVDPEIIQQLQRNPQTIIRPPNRPVRRWRKPRRHYFPIGPPPVIHDPCYPGHVCHDEFSIHVDF